MLSIYLVLAILLLLLNGFFVLAEFAMVKMRPSRVEELCDQGDTRAKLVRHIQTHMDDYLSVCQLGITFASIGLGFVGEPAIATIIEPFFDEGLAHKEAMTHTVAVWITYIIVSFLHILLGELVPKAMAIRATDRAALLTAKPLRLIHFFFYLPLVVLNSSANLFLRLLRLPEHVPEDPHSEEELRIILEQSQLHGLMSFRRLLLLENVFDFGNLKVKDSMRPRSGVRTLSPSKSREENLAVIRENRMTRYPVVKDEQSVPVGFLHVKDFIFSGGFDLQSLSLDTGLRRPVITHEDISLESLLSEFQRRRTHLAVVLDKNGSWSGIITLEDILEEIVGTFEDEFELEPQIFLGDVIAPDRVILDVQAPSIEEALKRSLVKIPKASLLMPPEAVVRLLRERATTMSPYATHGFMVAHARADGLERSILIVLRSNEGIPVRGQQRKIHLLLCLLTPSNAVHVQARLLARIGGLLESEYVKERLLDASTPEELVETLTAGESTTLA